MARPPSAAILLVLLSLITMTTSQDPSPGPNTDSPSPSPSPFHGSSSTSPPAPPAPASSPSPGQSPSSEPSPAPAHGGQHIVNLVPVDSLEERQKKESGMSGGKKAGIAFGVIAGLCVVGLAGFVYKKRQQNIERSQYGYGRREIPLSSF